MTTKVWSSTVQPELELTRTLIGDIGDYESGEKYEWENLAYVKGYEATVAELHKQLVTAVKTGLAKPMKR